MTEESRRDKRDCKGRKRSKRVVVALDRGEKEGQQDIIDTCAFHFLIISHPKIPPISLLTLTECLTKKAKRKDRREGETNRRKQ